MGHTGECRHKAGVGGSSDGGAGLAPSRDVVADQVEGVDGAAREVCEAVRKIIIVWTRNLVDVSC